MLQQGGKGPRVPDSLVSMTYWARLSKKLLLSQGWTRIHTNNAKDFQKHAIPDVRMNTTGFDEINLRFEQVLEIL